MKSRSLWLFPLVIGCLLLSGISDAEAGKKKAKAEKVKSEAATLKISNLTKETKAPAVKKLEKAIKAIKGVKKVAISKKKGELTVRFAKTATLDAIKGAVASAGFSLVEPKEDVPEPEDEPAAEPAAQPAPAEDSE